MRISILLLFAVIATAAASEPNLRVDPAEALADEAVAIRASGLEPTHSYTLRASAVDGNGRTFRSETPFSADTAGAFDSSKLGSAIDQMHPFWSMQISPETPPEKRPPPKFILPVSGCYAVHIEVTENTTTLASTSARRCVTAPGVSVTEVHDRGLLGRLYGPSGPAPHPAILVLTGSNGGIPDNHAALLASRGYVTLALAYFRVAPLPLDLVEIPIEYFETAIQWLKSRNSVDPTRVGVIGISKGGELAVLLSALEPHVFRAAVGIAPSAYVWEGGVRNPAVTGRASMKPNRSSWSYRGKPLPFVPKTITQETQRTIDTQGSVDMIEFYLPSLKITEALAKARIPVEHITNPVLLVSSTGDRFWPSSIQAQQVCATMNEHKLSCEHLQYDGAAHILTESWLPALYGIYPARKGRWDRASLGGTAEGTAEASADSWPKILRFFEANLRK